MHTYACYTLYGSALFFIIKFNVQSTNTDFFLKNNTFLIRLRNLSIYHSDYNSANYFEMNDDREIRYLISLNSLSQIKAVRNIICCFVRPVIIAVLHVSFKFNLIIVAPRYTQLSHLTQMR